MRHAVVTLLLATSAAFAATAANARAQPRTDSFGDPLPAGALYRLGTIRLRHQGTQALFFSTDGAQLLSHGSGELRLWDVASGELKQQRAAPKDCRRLLASPDDRFLAAVADNSVVLVEKASGKELARWEYPRGWGSLAFSGDGRELVGLSADQTIVKWDTVERKEVARVKLDVTNVDVKRFTNRWHLSPDGSIAAFMPPVAGGEKSATWHFWDTATGKPSRPSIKTEVSPEHVCWSPDAKRLAVVAGDNTVGVWDCLEGKRLPFAAGKALPLGSSYNPRSAAFHPNGKMLAVANSGSVAVWDINANKPLWTRTERGSLLVFSRDGKSLAIGGSDEIRIVDATSGEPIGATRRDPGSIWVALAWGYWGQTAFAADGQSFMVHDAAGLSQIDTATGKRIRLYGDTKSDGWSYGGLCHDGRLLLRVGDAKGGAHVFAHDPDTGKELWRRAKQPMAIYASADSKTLAVLSWKQDALFLLDGRTAREIKKCKPPSPLHDGNTRTAASDDLRLIAMAHNRGGIDLWDLTADKITRTLDSPTASAEGYLKFAPGNKLLVASRHRRHDKGSEAAEYAAVWNVETGRKLHAFDDPIYAMSPDGQYVACETAKGVAIRHLRTGKLIAAIAGSFPDTHSNPAPLTFSPDGSMVAIRSSERDEYGLWDTVTGQRVGKWTNPRHPVGTVEFSPDSRTLLFSDYGGGALLVCDVTGSAKAPGKLAPIELTRPEVERYWRDLMGNDGARAHQARWTLVAAGSTTVDFLRKILRPEEPLDAKKIAGLLAALDSGDFKKREAATQELERLPLARPALEAALAKGTSLELRRRIELILDANQPSHDARAMRGVRLLEQIASPEARAHLQSLADGAAGSMLTQEAQAAIGRLQRVHAARPG